MPAQAQKLSPTTLSALARFAGLKLSRQRLEELAPQVQDLLSRAARLDEVELGETEPAFILPIREK
ncbi:MAG: hypothetical protein HY686_04730 [Chloroflexi bacterium]|nr:hypothetical protein [Chloroflexota bacterium]